MINYPNLLRVCGSAELYKFTVDTNGLPYLELIVAQQTCSQGDGTGVEYHVYEIQIGMIHYLR